MSLPASGSAHSASTRPTASVSGDGTAKLWSLDAPIVADETAAFAAVRAESDHALALVATLTHPSFVYAGRFQRRPVDKESGFTSKRSAAKGLATISIHYCNSHLHTSTLPHDYTTNALLIDY